MMDDASMAAILDSAALAQVMQYLDLAIASGKTNITAELLTETFHVYPPAFLSHAKYNQNRNGNCGD